MQNNPTSYESLFFTNDLLYIKLFEIFHNALISMQNNPTSYEEKV